MRILIATDGERHSQVALSELLRLPLRHRAHVRVLTVIPRLHLALPPSRDGDGAGLFASANLYDRMEEDAQHIVGETAERLAANGATIETAIRLGDPATQIVEAAREWNADLIVLGCRQRSGLLAWLEGGSVSRRVLRRAPCSVLVAPIACDQCQSESEKRRTGETETSPLPPLSESPLPAV